MAKYDIEKFNGKKDFVLWRLKMCAFLVQQGYEDAMGGEKKDLLDKTHNAIILCLGGKVLREVFKEKSIASLWLKLENPRMTKLLTNCMQTGASIEDHMDEFSYDNLVDTLVYGMVSLALKDVQAALTLEQLSKKSNIKNSDTAEGLTVRGCKKNERTK
ncbi:hypothetical protein CR513_56055, partial [Mucuna pruriens]